MHKKQKGRAKERRQAARKNHAAAKARRQTIMVWGPEIFTRSKELKALGFQPIFTGRDGVYTPSSNCDRMAPLVTYAVPKTAQVTKVHDAEIVVTLRDGKKVTIFDNRTQWSQVTISYIS